MQYSQKYCLVAFREPQKVGTSFGMTEWPLHITLADVFWIDRKETNIDSKLQNLLAQYHKVVITAKNDSTLGETPVVLIEKNEELTNLHNRVIDLLESNSAVFNTPQFTREGFIPHFTIQKTERLQPGDTTTISQISLIDMFPNSDWRQRKVLGVYKLPRASDNSAR